MAKMKEIKTIIDETIENNLDTVEALFHNEIKRHVKSGMPELNEDGILLIADYTYDAFILALAKRIEDKHG